MSRRTEESQFDTEELAASEDVTHFLETETGNTADNDTSTVTTDERSEFESESYADTENIYENFLLGSPIRNPKDPELALNGDELFKKQLITWFLNTIKLHNEHMYAPNSEEIIEGILINNIRNLSPEQRNFLIEYFVDVRFISVLSLFQARAEDPSAMQAFINHISSKHGAHANDNHLTLQSIAKPHGQIYDTFISDRDLSLRNIILKIIEEEIQNEDKETNLYKERAPYKEKIEMAFSVVERVSEEAYAKRTSPPRNVRNRTNLEEDGLYESSNSVITSFIELVVNDVEQRIIDLCFIMTSEYKDYIANIIRHSNLELLSCLKEHKKIAQFIKNGTIEIQEGSGKTMLDAIAEEVSISTSLALSIHSYLLSEVENIDFLSKLDFLQYFFHSVFTLRFTGLRDLKVSDLNRWRNNFFTALLTVLEDLNKISLEDGDTIIDTLHASFLEGGSENNDNEKLSQAINKISGKELAILKSIYQRLLDLTDQEAGLHEQSEKLSSLFMSPHVEILGRVEIEEKGFEKIYKNFLRMLNQETGLSSPNSTSASTRASRTLLSQFLDTSGGDARFLGTNKDKNKEEEIVDEEDAPSPGGLTAGSKNSQILPDPAIKPPDDETLASIGAEENPRKREASIYSWPLEEDVANAETHIETPQKKQLLRSKAKNSIPEANRAKPNTKLSGWDILFIAVGLTLITIAVAAFIYLTIQSFGVVPVLVSGGAATILSGGAGGSAGAGLLAAIVGLRKKITNFFSSLWKKIKGKRPATQETAIASHSADDIPRPGAGAGAGASSDSALHPGNNQAQIDPSSPTGLHETVHTKKLEPESSSDSEETLQTGNHGAAASSKLTKEERDQHTVETMIHHGGGILTQVPTKPVATERAQKEEARDDDSILSAMQ